MNYEEFTNQIKEAGYELHHASMTRGYVSRKNKEVIKREYNGRFGNGYVILLPRWDTSQYVTIEYWIKQED